MKKTLSHYLGPLIGLVLFIAALAVLHHELQSYTYDDIVRQFGEIPARRLLLAFFLTLLSYLVLTWNDTLAFHYIQFPIEYRRIGPASFISYAFSNNIGLSMITGSTVRYRLYSVWGLSAIDITKVIAFCTLTFWLGLFATAGLVFLLQPLPAPSSLSLPLQTVRPLGLVFLALVAGYLFATVVKKKPLKIRGWEFALPSPRLSLFQITVAALDWVMAGSVLYVLLPRATGVSYFHFLGIFLLAQVAGLVSQVPGGIGVFESLVLVLLPSRLPDSAVLGTLLVYRGVYYLIPLGFAAVLMAAHELTERKEGVTRAAQRFGQWAPGMVPRLFAFMTFVGGSVLLFSGATPAATWRLSWLNNFLPLPVIEISHFLGSLTGVALLLLAHGLQRRLDAAYHLAVILLSLGTIVSLLKGADYEEAIVLALMLATLVPCRRHFYRKAALTTDRFSAGWTVSIFLILLASLWLGIFSSKHVEYSGEVWWRFVLSGRAPLFLRATVVAVAASLFLSAAKLLSPAPPEPSAPRPVDLEQARRIVTRERNTTAGLALLGDKSLLFSERGNAFIMYGIERRSWVALGDPAGEAAEFPELIWRFREICDLHDGWTVFYEVGAEHHPLYVELGLTLLKLGEEARVPLESFSVEGGSRKSLRHTRNRLEKEGYVFGVIAPADVAPLLPALKKISEAWLTAKQSREKKFSMGFFNPEYLERFPSGIVRRNGEVVAFANILIGAEKEELSVDLMRYIPEEPDGIMDFLLSGLMLWGKTEGYRWFNLGMAPLSGLEGRAFGPLWSRVGSMVFRYGEHFYHFQGLREYKEKFDPVWEPKYLASPDGLFLPRILTDIAALIAGGMKGIVMK